MEGKRVRTTRRVVKKNTKALLTAIHAVWRIHGFNSAIIASTQPKANIRANDIKPSEQDLNVLKAWNDVWLAIEPLCQEMQKAGWIDAKRVQSAFDQIRSETKDNYRTV